MAENLLEFLRLYLLVGGLVAAWFCFYGLGKVDGNGEGAWVFRPLILPGLVMLWPLVVWRLAQIMRGWDEAERHVPPRKIQDRMGIMLAVFIPFILAICLSVKQERPLDAPAILLAPPSDTAPETGTSQ